MSDKMNRAEVNEVSGPAKSEWISPRLDILPRLSELTLQSAQPIPGGGGTGGGGSTVVP